MLNKVKGKINRLVKEGKDVYYEKWTELGYYYNEYEWFETRKYTIGEIVVNVEYIVSDNTPKSAIIKVSHKDFSGYLTREEIVEIGELLFKVYQKQEQEREGYMLNTAIQYLEEE